MQFKPQHSQEFCRYLILSENLITQSGPILNHGLNGKAIANGTDDISCTGCRQEQKPRSLLRVNQFSSHSLGAGLQQQEMWLTAAAEV